MQAVQPYDLTAQIYKRSAAVARIYRGVVLDNVRRYAEIFELDRIAYCADHALCGSLEKRGIVRRAYRNDSISDLDRFRVGELGGGERALYLDNSDVAFRVVTDHGRVVVVILVVSHLDRPCAVYDVRVCQNISVGSHYNSASAAAAACFLRHYLNNARQYLLYRLF